MPLTNVSYPQNARFAAPRSYRRGVQVGYGPAATVTVSGDVIHVHAPVGPASIDSYITMDHRFVPWSSNRWTTDHIFVDQYTILNGIGPLYFHANISEGALLAAGKWGVGFIFDGWSNLYEVFLPDAPPSYWLPEIA